VRRRPAPPADEAPRARQVPRRDPTLQVANGAVHTARGWSSPQFPVSEAKVFEQFKEYRARGLRVGPHHLLPHGHDDEVRKRRLRPRGPRTLYAPRVRESIGYFSKATRKQKVHHTGERLPKVYKADRGENAQEFFARQNDHGIASDCGLWP